MAVAQDLRFIVDPPRAAAFNMAADLHLLAAAAHDARVTVRLYAWTPKALSLGWNQRADQTLDRRALESDGGQWVRRPTGGRAVLHEHDFTYSVVFPRTLRRLGTTVDESYRIVSDCLARGLRDAGIECDRHDSRLDTALVRREGKLPCFLAPNRDEIMVAGRKLVGSAQKRTAGAVLQHGSFPLTSAFRDLPRYLRISDTQREAYARLLVQKCTCVNECAPGLTHARLAECLMRGFTDELCLTSEISSWSQHEIERIEARAGSAAFAHSYLTDERLSA